MKHLLFFGIAFAAFQFCYSDIPDFCTMPEDEGQGPEFKFAVYYDATSDRCNPFIYKGQGGNGNRFENERECIRNCSLNVDTIYPMDASKGCLLKKTAGQCNGKYLRYYYDYVHGKCKQFYWTGCIGNGNRFFSHESCNSTCAGLHADAGDENEEKDEELPDTPVAIILGVLLAVIVVGILITVTVLTIKSKKKKKAPGKSRDAKVESPLQESGIEMA